MKHGGLRIELTFQRKRPSIGTTYSMGVGLEDGPVLATYIVHDDHVGGLYYRLDPNAELPEGSPPDAARVLIHEFMVALAIATDNECRSDHR